MAITLPLISVGQTSDIYNGAFIDVIPIASPAKIRPITRTVMDEVKVIMQPPMIKSVSLVIIVFFLPNLSVKGPENRAPNAEPKEPIAMKVP